MPDFRECRTTAHLLIGQGLLEKFLKNISTEIRDSQTTARSNRDRRVSLREESQISQRKSQSKNKDMDLWRGGA